MRTFGIFAGFAMIAIIALSAADMAGAQQSHQSSPEPLSVTQSAPLAGLVDPPARIASANVKDAAGVVVGAVQRVEISEAGTPARVEVALIGKKPKLVWLDPAHLTYDAGSNEISAGWSEAQMRALPGRRS